MLIHLHRQATTTPGIRAAKEARTKPAPVPADRFGLTKQTVCKWRKRDSVEDRSHTPHRLPTTLTPAPEPAEGHRDAKTRNEILEQGARLPELHDLGTLVRLLSKGA